MGMMTDWTPTRAEGERLLADFIHRMGGRYANGRNTDHGRGAHKAVSVLSPYIRRRLVLEQDAVAAALAAHGPDDAGKFVQEVLWRGYFKGWLERRPQVWDSYRSGLEADIAALDRDRRLRRDHDRATGGQTNRVDVCRRAHAVQLRDVEIGIGVEKVMGFATEAQVERFLDETPTFERMLIDNTMRRHKGSIVAVMDELCLPRRTLNEKMAKYGLSRGEYV